LNSHTGEQGIVSESKNQSLINSELGIPGEYYLVNWSYFNKDGPYYRGLRIAYLSISDSVSSSNEFLIISQEAKTERPFVFFLHSPNAAAASSPSTKVQGCR
jgi:hypothetical protein